jgi:excisionase family DNA binding protein
MLTLSQVARWLQIHPNTLRRWANTGRIRSYRINVRGDRRFEETDIRKFLSESDNQYQARIESEYISALLKR